MTGAEKFALARAFHGAQMPFDQFQPQTRAWLRQQFDCCLNAVIDALELSDYDRRQIRALVERDNWLARDNPFKDDVA